MVFLFSFYVVFYQNILVGFFMFSFSVFLISTEGSEVDLTSKKYRLIWSFLGINFGTWKSLPKFEYISVFKSKQRQNIQSISARTSYTELVYLVNLFYEGNKHITFFKSLKKEEAMEVAGHFKFSLDLDILDATTTPRKWIK